MGLLHRTGAGWTEVGAVALDNPDLPEALGYLRSTALGLSPRGVATKLIIPNDQILYTEVVAPGPDDASRLAQIRSALEGRTPYDVNDLAFDWSAQGDLVQVAVIARRPHGYFITHVEGAQYPVVNGQAIEAQARALADHDVIEIAGIKMEFFLKP